jgi:hypothetical protein
MASFGNRNLSLNLVPTEININWKDTVSKIKFYASGDDSWHQVVLA